MPASNVKNDNQSGPPSFLSGQPRESLSVSIHVRQLPQRQEAEKWEFPPIFLLACL
jgi:hypothetical protein